MSGNESLAFCDVTRGDGHQYINIGRLARTALGRALGYYHNYPKHTQDGLTFNLYAGLYYYMITAGDNTRFLRAKHPRELEARRYFRWENVIGLESQLEAILSYNLRTSPVAIPLIIDNTLPIVWREPDHQGLRNNEKRWLRVVTRVVTRLRNEYTD